MFKRILPALTCFALAVSAAPVSASAVNAKTIVGRMIARNATLRSFKSRVHVTFRMTSFPFLAQSLDGTSYFKGPDNYEVVFDRVPRYARGFQNLFDDIGDPAAWAKDQNIALEGTRVLNGRNVFVLRLTKKIHSDIISDAVAYVDTASYTIPQMEWHYRDGGNIVMSQTFRSENGYTVLSSQHAVIHITRAHAVADSSYGPYQTNIAVDESVFQKR